MILGLPDKGFRQCTESTPLAGTRLAHMAQHTWDRLARHTWHGCIKTALYDMTAHDTEQTASVWLQPAEFLHCRHLHGHFLFQNYSAVLS